LNNGGQQPLLTFGKVQLDHGILKPQKNSNFLR
jgi:hypothetical protein